MGLNFNRLTAAEAERLACIAEEAGEIVQMVGKALRHGLDSHHPDGGESNRDALGREIGDLIAMATYAAECGDIDWILVTRARDAKLAKAKPYLHHQERFLS